MPASRLSSTHYGALAELRYQLRLFLNFSERAARSRGLEPQQHQLLLALEGLPAATPPTIGALAERMQLRHHSTGELIDRLERRGLVRRARSERDRRQVFIRITPRGAGLLRRLSLPHLIELRSRAPVLARALRALVRTRPKRGVNHRRSR